MEYILSMKDVLLSSEIPFEDWHCGHVVAHKNGGKVILENLRPVCKGCNWEMRTTMIELN